jgi:hypothetical protein
MKTIKHFFAFAVLLIFIVSCNSNSGTNYTEKEKIIQEVQQLSEEEIKEQLRLKECNNPEEYVVGKIKVEGVYKNAFSMKIKAAKFNLQLKSNASIAVLKDIRIYIRGVGKTGAAVIEKEFLISDYISPNGTLSYNNEFGLSNQDWENIQTFNWGIKDARCH